MPRKGGAPLPKGQRINILGRLIKMLFSFYPVMLPVTLLFILFNAIISSIPSVFMQNVLSLVEQSWQAGDWSAVSGQILRFVLILIGLYVLSLAAGATFNQLMAIITQGSLAKMREKMFNGMQDLPIKYFDTHNHGDVMSYYTNDIDTLRQLISQCIPQLLISVVTIVTVLSIMLYYSIWMTLVVLAGVVCMVLVTKKVGGGSARYFVRMQQSIGATEGLVEEMMNGQKVVKVFCHEEAAKADFDRVNDDLFHNAEQANRYANMLGPILNNIGNVLYVLVAVVSGILMMTGAPNFSISGLAFGISIVVPFLNMTKQFSGNVNQVSQQLNMVIMGLAGTQRIFDLIDQQPEKDEGYVTLVNAKENQDGTLTECEERTGLWAWKHPHQADGTVTYTRLQGEVVLDDVDFGYNPDKMVLHNISLYAKPGQKIAFVGSTGAGKTTITNLINRFYDIADGKIRYDGININKIKKADLRRSLGMVLQDTNLFTGTVMDNIRYGRLEATDEECIAAAKLAGAHDFITRLPQGYDTPLTGNGASLSQGQRQLLSIARAAVADPPVMILDEATSSIDTHTEAIVQKGMDALMTGRTVFVIAHRLSTVQNSDAIMVLDHGRIIERGTHDQLIAQHGTYYQLYTGALELE
ncbi:MAG TPA: ABC transporter ATP-binding protein/permease [Candidatus Acutalibacter pullistercoris]|uniref:ABC transporter ATP-binding protein/permease n=1 Tax=Candidatus Acutalibacter pullistercoris TaxID=2838418 RepID=A0A9D1YCN1_9FIRM|nr:ABC transporter ATP-binding protein/permease [Candidatus Acutalibacter pullistercoris]